MLLGTVAQQEGESSANRNILPFGQNQLLTFQASLLGPIFPAFKN